MPLFVAAVLPYTLTATAAGATAAAGIYGAHAQSGAARTAANTQAAAANRAAELEAQSAAAALQFQRDEAARDQANAEATQHANYEQWAARQRRLSDFGQSYLGLSPREIPPYLSPGTPGAPSTPGTSSTSGTSAPGAVPPVPKDLQTAIADANRLAYGGANKHSDPSYWQTMWAQDPGYTWKRLLGWQAGGADKPTMGPYATAAGAGATISTRPTTTPPATAYATPAAPATPYGTTAALSQYLPTPRTPALYASWQDDPSRVRPVSNYL